MNNQIVIDTVYRTRIEYNFDNAYDNFEKVDRFINQLDEKYPNLNTESQEGGPCWFAYFIIEGANKQEVLEYASELCRYIKRFKGYRIEF